MEGHGPREHTAVGHRCWYSSLRDGPAGGASGRPGVSAQLCAPLLDGRLSGVHNGVADTLWVLGAACAPPGHRASPEAALDATAPAALCAGAQDRALAAPGARASPRGV